MSHSEPGGDSLTIEFDIRLSAQSVPAEQRNAILAAPEFGRVFTDHMITIRWTADDGWHDPRLGPYEPLSLYPGTSVFHYSQEIFEGTKAYRHEGGPVALSVRRLTQYVSIRPRAASRCPNCPKGSSSAHLSCSSPRTSNGYPAAMALVSTCALS